jgi:GNAT superfamily N-acetyltransferase
MSALEQMLKDLNHSMTHPSAHGFVNNRIWSVEWRFGVKRIEDKARDNVFSIATIEIHGASRGRGNLTALLRHLIEYPELAGHRIDWLYFEQCRYRLANHLVRELHFHADHGLVIDAWRRVTGQLEMSL